MFAETLRYLHITSLALWFGGLFGYVMIVWPSIFSTEQPAFPRQLLTAISVRTAPWIYLAMGSALISLLLYFAFGLLQAPIQLKLLYLVILMLLIANNVYGSVVAWPRIMLTPDKGARKSWRYFYLRMVISLVLGLTLLSLAIVVR